MKQQLGFLLPLILVMVGGCPSVEGPVPIPRKLSCEQLDDYLKRLRETGFKDNGSSASLPFDGAVTSDAAPSSGDPVAPAPVAEADFVKTDGSFIYLVRTDRSGEYGAPKAAFSSFHVDGNGLLAELDSLPLEGEPIEFLLAAGNKAIVISHDFRGNREGTTVHQLNLSAPEKIRRLNGLHFPGHTYVTSRLVGETVHLVATRSISPRDLREESAEAILPQVETVGDDGTLKERRIGSCGRTFIPDKKTGEPHLGPMLALVSFPVGADIAQVTGVSVLTGLERPIVSVNSRSIYVGIDSDDEGSEIYRFSIDGSDGGAAFVAKGRVPGTLATAFDGGGYNDQFTMDEYEDHLRVVTTAGQLSRNGFSSVESSLYVMSEEGEDLKVVGEIRDLHPDEAVYAVRLIGNRGYVVTFKKIDPLFVLDLSDPENPKKVGELEVPGFSTYLTPIDEKTLLAIGKDVDDQGSFAWFGGLKLSLFDVSEPAAPRLIDSVTIGERGTDSEALTDHRAFNYFPNRGILALPVDLVTEVPDEDGWGWRPVGSPDHSEEQVWRVDPVEGFSQLAAIRHDDLAQEPEPVDEARCQAIGCYYTSYVQMRRAMEVGDRLLTVSDDAFKVSDFGSWEELSSLALDTIKSHSLGQTQLTVYADVLPTPD